MDRSLIPKAVKVTSQRRPKTPRDGYTIHNAPIFLSSCPPRSQSFQWSSFREGLDVAISSVELSFSPLSSFPAPSLRRGGWRGAWEPDDFADRTITFLLKRFTRESNFWEVCFNYCVSSLQQLRPKHWYQMICPHDFPSSLLPVLHVDSRPACSRGNTLSAWRSWSLDFGILIVVILETEVTIFG